ncbi:hypothetical protein [Parvibaculum sp.]|uniref:hypothetical protein n=1 Tax=Parvibaculum sp. TaxID=2024848 RepID=UPI0032EF3718
MYKTTVKPFQERREVIEQATKTTKESLSFFEYQNTKHELPVVRLDISLPVYRMENFRTRTAQMKYVHDNGKAADFFRASQENESAQQAQHDILLMFARQGRAISVSPIIEELESETQREPLLVSASGVVVNGNRRLAAMRHLFAERPSEFRHFSHVDCAILPGNVTPDEVREIEVRLQMRPETKLPYGWVNESLAIQELLQSGRKIEYIADLMKKKKKDVERAARALTEAEIYLKEWLREPGEYQNVEDAEQFFNDLAKALEGKQGESLEISRRIAWALVSNSRSLKRRVYDYNFSFDKRTDEVIASLVDRIGVDLSKPADDGGSNSDDLDVDLGGDNEVSSLEPLIDVFDDVGQRQSVTNELIAVCDSILEEDRQGEIGRRALECAQAANSKLQEIDLTKAEPATYDALAAQLDSVMQRTSKLKTSLQAYQSKAASS